ncbi:amidohydrolase family protein [Streptomyces sp. GbtcB7]|uniref:amidohydrolase family protein n=1 Tax=Streptomyces sp. GbtcB7 TaxID=2824752 RepID=UPI001C3114D9|nr:amidohydrolase family protein [Streptomyces sp. GbtcB7]
MSSDSGTGRDLVVDVHAHWFPLGLTDQSARTGDPRWPHLVADDEGSGRIMRGSEVFRKVSRSLWDVPARLADLDAAGVDLQVLSPVPVTLAYWGDPKAAEEFLREQNDLLAEAVAASGGRLAAIGAVPLQEPGAAVRELRRLTGELGLVGAEIGTQVAGHELDDPELRPFFAAAEELGVPLLVHPTDGGGATRRRGQPYEFGVGMLTDTALSATALVFGGVLEEFPGLRVALAHGCGSFPWTYPRTRAFATATGGATAPARYDELVGTLWVDSLVFDPEHLRLLTTRFGADHLMVGSDHPFLPGYLRPAHEIVTDAAGQGVLTPTQTAGVLGRNAVEFFGLTPATAGRADTDLEEIR